MLFIVDEFAYEFSVLVFLNPMSLSHILLPFTIVPHLLVLYCHFTLSLPIVCNEFSNVLIFIFPLVFSKALLLIQGEASFVSVSIGEEESGCFAMFHSTFELAFIAIATLNLNAFALFFIVLPTPFVFVLLV